MEPIEIAVYLLFAIAHPLSELVGRTNLREFLNKVYYRTGRDEFPVNRLDGVVGSSLVLVALAAPLVFSNTVALWFLVLGLVVADLIQHATHFVLRPGEPGPRVYLPTILGVLLALSWVLPSSRDWSTIKDNWLWLILGASLIFGKWLLNSSRVHNAAGSPATP